MTQCSSCKNNVQSGSAFCPFCGSSLSQASASLSPYSLDPDALPYDERLPFREYTPSGRTSPSTVSASPTVEPAAEQTPGFVTATPPGVFPVSEVQPVAAPLPRRVNSIGTMALLGLLSLLLIVSVSGFAYYAVVAAPADLHAQATGVAQAYLTAQARSTEQASTQAINKLLAMTPQALYNQVTSGTPIIDDPLTKPGGNVWFDYNFADDETCRFVNGAYHAQASNASSLFCGSVESFFKDMAFQVEVTIAKGDRGGFIFDISSGGFYSFTISPEGDYGFLLAQDRQGILLRGSSSSAITPGLNQPNLLTVIAIAHHFYLYINQSFVAQILDDTYSSGFIALQSSMNAGQGNLDVAFHNAKAWEI